MKAARHPREVGCARLGSAVLGPTHSLGRWLVLSVRPDWLRDGWPAGAAGVAASRGRQHVTGSTAIGTAGVAGQTELYRGPCRVAPEHGEPHGVANRHIVTLTAGTTASNTETGPNALFSREHRHTSGLRGHTSLR